MPIKKHFSLFAGSKIIYFLFFAACLLFLSCKNKVVSCPDTIQMPATLKKDESCKTLLLIAEDRSGSTANHRKLSAGNYSQIFTTFIEKMTGQVAVRIIGNPTLQDQEFFRFNAEPPYQPVSMPGNANLDDEGLNRCQNEKIDKMNNQIKSKNQDTVKSFVQSVVEPKIIQYKPDAKKDVTNIADALQHIQELVNEPTFENSKIIVLIISDGEQTSSTLKSPLTFNPNKPLTVYLVGWKDTSVFSKVPDIKNFESIEGFLAFFKSINCKK